MVEVPDSKMVIVLEGSGFPLCHVCDMEGLEGDLRLMLPSITDAQLDHIKNDDHWSIDDNGRPFGYVGANINSDSLRIYRVNFGETPPAPPVKRGRGKGAGT